MISAKAKPLDILALAIKSEIEAARFYQKILARIKADLLKQKVRFLVREEKKHRVILLRLCRQRFGQVPSSLPEKGIEPGLEVPSSQGLKVIDLFQLALKAERTAEAFYREAREKVEDDLARHILDYLRRVERSHAALILSELDLLERFPEHYDVAAFHFGEELVHIGP